MKIKQINNLQIHYDIYSLKYKVLTPNKKIIEEFDSLIQAKIYCKNTKDFVRTNNDRTI